MRPLPEVLETVLADRGGAPLHFVLSHAVFWIETSAEALRWLSVVAAVAAVPLCFDLARRLAGVPAGIVAAAVVASSTALAVYGSFGRMYALYVFVAALAADLFVRALRERTTGSVAAAAASAWLLPAVHPYGAIPALVELAVAVVLWRRRSFGPAIAVGVAVVAAMPFALAGLRLAERASVGEGGRSLASPGDAWRELVAALSAFAGGDGIPLVALTALAVVGLVVLARRERAVAALAASVLLPPVLFLALRSESAPDLSPRHLFYGLPLWAAAIGVATQWLRRWLPPRGGIALIAAVALLAALAPPSALTDPRELQLTPSEINAAVVAREGDLLVPYAIPFLAALHDVKTALPLPQGAGEDVAAALEHAEEPIVAVHVAVPKERWEVVTLRGAYSKDGALTAAVQALDETQHPRALDWWYALVRQGLCDGLAELGSRCPG